MSIYLHLSPHPGPLPWGEGELFAADLDFVSQQQFVSQTKFQEMFDCCSLSPRERVRVRGNDIFK